MLFNRYSPQLTNTSGPDNLLLDKDLVISRTNRQFEVAIRNIVSFIIDTIVDPLKEIKSDRYELSRLRRIILFNTSKYFLKYVRRCFFFFKIGAVFFAFFTWQSLLFWFQRKLMLVYEKVDTNKTKQIISATKSTHQNLKDPVEVRKLRKTEHLLLQKYTNKTPGRFAIYIRKHERGKVWRHVRECDVTLDSMTSR